MDAQTLSREQIVEEWIKALQIGDYNQGKGLLRSDNGFCCLGVLCDVVQKHGIGRWKKVKRLDCYEFIIEGENYFSFLPEKVAQLVGLASRVGVYDSSSLAADNDIKRLSFEEIAEIILSHPKGMFVAKQPKAEIK
jgi:hypothetical protein